MKTKNKFFHPFLICITFLLTDLFSYSQLPVMPIYPANVNVVHAPMGTSSSHADSAFRNFKQSVQAHWPLASVVTREQPELISTMVYDSLTDAGTNYYISFAPPLSKASYYDNGHHSFTTYRPATISGSIVGTFYKLDTLSRAPVLSDVAITDTLQVRLNRVFSTLNTTYPTYYFTYSLSAITYFTTQGTNYKSIVGLLVTGAWLGTDPY